jgi:hypothetical protein
MQLRGRCLARVIDKRRAAARYDVGHPAVAGVEGRQLRRARPFRGLGSFGDGVNRVLVARRHHAGKPAVHQHMSNARLPLDDVDIDRYQPGFGVGWAQDTAI